MRNKNHPKRRKTCKISKGITVIHQITNDAMTSRKSALRSLARKMLLDQTPNRDAHSEQIWKRLVDLPVFANLERENRIMVYLDLSPEVCTNCFLTRYLGLPDMKNATPQRNGPLSIGPVVVVPYCENEDIRAYRIDDLAETESGRYGILEPKVSVRAMSDRCMEPKTIDLILVPGLAFDSAGNRLGRGKGYYDRFLAQLRPSCPVIALAFDCQIFPTVPIQPWDRPVDLILTETRTLNPRDRK